jgi:hypothetical protein
MDRAAKKVIAGLDVAERTIDRQLFFFKREQEGGQSRQHRTNARELRVQLFSVKAP